MNTSLETLRGYQLRAKDGTIGRIRDILVEEDHWTGRWVVADTGTWLLGRKVVLSPLAFSAPDHESKEIPVSLTKEQIESAPDLDTEAPVSREFEKSYYDHYQWPYYWMGGGLWGNMTDVVSFNTHANDVNPDPGGPEPVDERETVLRSGHELTKYRLRSGDEIFGYVEDMMMDTDDWSVSYFQCDTRKWWHGKTMQISPEKVTHADWPDHSLYVDVSRGDLEHAERESADGDPPIHAQIRAIFGMTST